MKKINDQQLTKYAIPDGEGFTALPIAFKYVIASARCEAISRLLRRHLRRTQVQVLPRRAKALLAMTEYETR